MKKIVLISLFLLPLIAVAQDDNDYAGHSELKVNMLNLIVMEAVDFSYEYLINPQSSVGVSAFYNLKDDDASDFEKVFGFYYREKFALTPHYRYNFLNTYSKAFFIEGFCMYNEQKYFDKYLFNSNEEKKVLYADETSNNVAIGVAVGGKFVSKGGFVFELYGGVGRNIHTSNNDIATEMVRRVGASIGFRF